ncbi:MAG: hypothetical protein R3213_04210 [Flavobacteriaceae bacterium]|nr:hypothetical protein [Flavobacteriaceae bacterium]
MILEALAPVIVSKVVDALSSGGAPETVDLVKNVVWWGDLLISSLISSGILEVVARKIPSKRRLGVLSAIATFFRVGHQLFETWDYKADKVIKPKRKE